MKAVINTDYVDSLTIDGKKSTFAEFDQKIVSVINERNIDIMEYSISNKYLRAVIKSNGYEYHVLEKPAGINNIHCVGGDKRKKTLKFDMPYTVMIVKLLYLNGNYIKKGDRIFHTNEPIKKDLSNTLWRWGLSNVWEGNYICWGKETLPNIDNQTTYQYIDEFFLSIKNNDLLFNKEINWATMKTDVVHKLDINKLTRLPFKINDIIGQTGF